MDMEKVVYKSKVDYWILVVILAVVVAASLPVLFLEDGFTMATLFSAVLAVATIALIMNVILGTRYTIVGNMLKVNCGIIYMGSYDIMKMKCVKKAKYDIYSAPAASLDRIQIVFQRYSGLVVSPLDKTEFVAALQNINPNITSEL